MAKSVKPLIGIGALLLGGLVAAVPAGAQTPVPQCNGQDATIFFNGWTSDDVSEPTDEDFGSLVGLLGTDDDDVIVVGPPSNDLVSDFRSISVHGLAGDDSICFSGVTGETIGDLMIPVFGGAGNDTIFNFPDTTILRQNFIWGEDGDDIIHGSNGDDLLIGGPGDDQIFGYQGTNLIAGEAGDDTIRGGSGLDLIAGGDGDDTIFGAQDGDLLYGGLGKDTIFGGSGNDIIASNDDFIGYAESEFEGTPPGTFGPETPSFGQDTAGGRMFGGVGNDIIIGSNRWDRMQGGAGDDLLLGMEGRDWIRGGTGNDIILGGGGIDNINGNQGNDEIVLQGADIGKGGFGIDTCTTGLAGTANPTIRSCERSADVDLQWPAVAERINETHGTFGDIAIG